MNNRIVTKSKLFNRLAKDASFDVRTNHSTQAGVKITTSGTKKGTQVEVVLPSTNSSGEDRVIHLTMTGRQARALYETLNSHYGKLYSNE